MQRGNGKKRLSSFMLNVNRNIKTGIKYTTQICLYTTYQQI